MDKLITHIDRIVSDKVNSTDRQTETKKDLSEPDPLQLSLQLMKINHCGEICAQALYYGQALTARTQALENKLLQAAEEEKEHLRLCKNRIQALGGNPSLLDPLFGISAFSLGCVAGLLGDKMSLGFIAETEQQVMAHLDNHLLRLPKIDGESREILQKMRQDEAQHATDAIEAGGVPLPFFARKMMRIMAKIMTTLTPHF